MISAQNPANRSQNAPALNILNGSLIPQQGCVCVCVCVCVCAAAAATFISESTEIDALGLKCSVGYVITSSVVSASTDRIS